ncbi:triple tyrosine motif-containing protein [Neobacillus drentensis]|uniref:triple tyrosine motif-containing protein n=3 Tax=Neobacillus drentensis TaxID=220684 RepID=UPI000824537E|nr:triple tyrosine motif-containing protein [Neobacillus drentensis]
MDFSSQDTGLNVFERSGYYYISGLRQKDNRSSLFLVKLLNKNIQLTAVKTDLRTPQVKNTSIQVTVRAIGGVEKLYKFWINDGTGWKVVQNYSTSNTFNWIPTATGEYQISVYVKDKYSTSIVDAYKIINYTIINEVPSPIILTNVRTDLVSPQVKNTNIQVTAEATGGIEKLYQFWINDGNGWKVVQNYSTSNTFNWVPTATSEYQISVYVKDKYSTSIVDAYKIINYTIINEVPSPVTLTNVRTDLVSPQVKNISIQVTSEAMREIGKMYKFWVNDGTGWKVVQNYSTNNTFNWVPTNAGEYQISVYVKDKYSTRTVDDYKIIKYVIIDNEK